ncbi:hypothetical protein [Bacteroides sp.]|uniref:hypothetical protein n=1 Tax=Bacteroides sp. TaxID=29523 RepID=UPI0026196618|nr:hypothetical protein [Bacteroides sp.]MDD3039063.1 hypothetical protein [Bacteroides sp.]
MNAIVDMSKPGIQLICAKDPIAKERLENGLCPFCGTSCNPGIFRDELSIKESRISGLCQSCQDEVFKEE